MIHDQTKKYEWDATETSYREKSVDWYWGLGIIIVTGIIICILTKNYLLSVILLLGGFLVGYHANDKPGSVHVSISEHGIKINKDLYMYENIVSFWMYTDQFGKNRLILKTNRNMAPQHILRFSDDLPANEIRAYLKRYIEEKEEKPSIIHIIADGFGL